MNPHENSSLPIISSKSVPRRFFGWLFSWRSVKWAFKGAAILITLAAVALSFENWRGKRAWNKFKSEWEAKGEKFELSAHIPTGVPDDQNFASTPLFSPLFQYKYRTQTNKSQDPFEPRSVEWSQTNAMELSENLNMTKPPRKGTNAPSFGSSVKGSVTDIAAWQAFYRGNTNYAQASVEADAPTTLLTALGKIQPALEELRAISHRPHTVFPVHYEENAEALLAHLAPMKSLVVGIRLRTTALLNAGRPEEALADVRLGWRLIDALRQEPLLISQLVRIAMIQITVDSIWEGLARNQWKEPHIVELQGLASHLDMLSAYASAIRGERGFCNALMDRMHQGDFRLAGAFGEDSVRSPFLNAFRFAPGGMLYQNQVLINRLHQEAMLSAVDAKQHRVFPNVTVDLERSLLSKRPTPYNVLARLLFPAFTKFSAKIARSQNTLDCLATACALERFRFAKQDYPSELSALVPTYLASVPTDVMDGKPLRYTRNGTNNFTLYSIGWDEKDDGGTPLNRKKLVVSSEAEDGDWVWKARP